MRNERLYEIWKSGDESARDRLIEQNVGLARAAAAKYDSQPSEGIDRDDIRSAAYIGLIHAVDSWDPARAALSTHVYWKIRSEVRRLFESRHLIRVPAHAQHADAPEVTTRVVATPVMKNGSDALEVLGGVEDEPTDELPGDLQADEVREAVNALPPRERHVITRLYDDDAAPTVVADELEVSKQRVHQLHTRAKERLALRLAPAYVKGGYQ